MNLPLYAPELALAPLAGPAPLVIAQLGQSLDGRIATPSGDSFGINGDGALDHLHRLRAAVDAVVVGIGTVLADDPQLTVRRVAGRHPARVVVDPRGRLPEMARLLRDDGTTVLWVTCCDAPPPPGAEAVRLAAPDGRIAPQALLAALARRGLARVLIEGGAETISRCIDAGVVDRLHMLVAPVILGSGTVGLSLAPIADMRAARRPQMRAFRFAEGDVLFDCDLRAR